MNQRSLQTKLQTVCPHTEQWQAYLFGSLEKNSHVALEDHLESCSACEAAVQSLIGNQSFLNQSFLNQSFLDPFEHETKSESDTDRAGGSEPPPVLPRYQHPERIAAGGFGVVWKVFDTQLNRIVALKVMKQSDANNKRLVRKFFAEAQICSQLTHPFIVPIHELGTLPDGRGYFAMKLIEGQRLDLAFAEPSDNWMPRIGAFKDVCLAMAHAHQQRVIHRDLKPQNIMVGEFGEIQVMDWGLAKVITESAVEPESESAAESPAARTVTTIRTQHDQTAAGGAGTLAYMPPEQAVNASAANFQSDVFSLGAILCELLTGQPPHRTSKRASFFYRVREADLLDTFERLENCGADPRVITIAVECLQPNPADRPADAGEVAKRVRSFVDDVEQELQAERVNVAKRDLQLAEGRKQRRLWIAVASLLLVALCISVAGIFATNSARKKSVAAQQSAENLAIENSKLVDNKNQVLQFLTNNIFGYASPVTEPDRHISFRQVLDKATEQARTMELASEIKTEILIELGKVYFNLSEYPLSYDLYFEASHIGEAELGLRHPLTMTSLDQLAKVLIRMERFAEAEPVLLQAIELQNEVLGPEHEDSVHSYAKLGDLYSMWGKLEQGIAITEEVLALRRHLWGDEYEFVLVSMNGLSLLYTKSGRFQEAVDLLRDTVQVSLKIHGPQHADTLAYKNNLALALLDTGELAEADRLASEALTGRLKILSSDHSDIFASRNTVAWVKFEQGKWQAALNDCESMLADFPDPVFRFAAVLILQSRCLIKLERGEEAEPLLKQADQIALDLFGEGNPYSKKVAGLLAEISANSQHE